MCCVDICMHMYVRESDDICVCVTLLMWNVMLYIYIHTCTIAVQYVTSVQ